VRGAGGGTDKEIIAWANEKVAGKAKPITGFDDKSIGSGLYLIELLAAVESRCINRDLVTAGVTEEEQKLNAKYVISSARKINCSLFLLWEDLVEVKPKMVLSFIAAVMALELQMHPPPPPPSLLKKASDVLAETSEKAKKMFGGFSSTKSGKTKSVRVEKPEQDQNAAACS